MKNYNYSLYYIFTRRVLYMDFYFTDMFNKVQA